MVKLIIFDLDGTLADTGQDITNALNHALLPFNAQSYSVEETKAMVGTGISNLLVSLITPSQREAYLRAASEQGKNSSTPEEIVLKRFLEHYAAHLLDNTVLYPHVKETLVQFGGYTKTVLSNKRTAYSREIIEKLGISEYFDSIWGSDSVREKKPSPVPVLDLLDRFGLSKEEAVIVGDSNFDVEAGNAAGIKVIGASYGFRSRDFLEGSDAIIDSFDELLKVIPRI